MARRHIRPDAEDDLDSIWFFVAEDSPRAADATIDRLTETFDMLLTMSQAGRTRPEFGKNLRSFAVDNYVKVPEGIDIFRVIHGRRNFHPDDVE
jgi:toxin ParE1/3/4